MKKAVYLQTNVFEEALNRIERLYNDFDEVIVGFSGGKDSTVVLNLAIMVATKLDRLPVKTVFIDQEAEWECVIDYVRATMHRPEVEPMWYQMPLQIFNATSHDTQWLECWAEGGDWIREKEPDSIHDNHFGTKRFGKLFNEILKQDIKSKRACLIGGVRCEESPARTSGLTNQLTYKDIAWGKAIAMPKGSDEERYIFYPIYDWKLSDVWKAINDNKWEYTKLYDYQYQHGVALHNMRVSNINHETATIALHYMQEVEPQTFQLIQQRLEGVNTEKTLQKEGYVVQDLPYMFRDWEEYRNHLMEGLVKQEAHKKKLNSYVKMYERYEMTSKTFLQDFNREMVKAILKNDYHSTTMGNFFIKPTVATYAMYKSGKIVGEGVDNIYVKEDMRNAKKTTN